MKKEFPDKERSWLRYYWVPMWECREKEMFLGSVKEAESYGANVLMVYTGAPQNTRRKEIGELRIDEGISYAEKAGIRKSSFMLPILLI